MGPVQSHHPVPGRCNGVPAPDRRSASAIDVAADADERLNARVRWKTSPQQRASAPQFFVLPELHRVRRSVNREMSHAKRKSAGHGALEARRQR